MSVKLMPRAWYVVLSGLVGTALLVGCGSEQGSKQAETNNQQWQREGVSWSDAQLQQLSRGQAIYQQTCAACHLKNGQGQTVIGAPALAGNRIVTATQYNELLLLILNGRSTMPAFASSLDDLQLADLASYLRNAWDNRANDTVSASQVTAVRP